MKITEVVPWLVGSEGTGWGEYLFVEVRTDEGVSGWGEITTTTPTANRGIAAMVRQVNDLLTSDDPARIEDTWHKVFRAFTYMGSRGAGTNVTSAVDIALRDIRGKVLGLPVYELLGGKVRDEWPSSARAVRVSRSPRAASSRTSCSAAWWSPALARAVRRIKPAPLQRQPP
jgi:galactonate dehydratase